MGVGQELVDGEDLHLRVRVAVPAQQVLTVPLGHRRWPLTGVCPSRRSVVNSLIDARRRGNRQLPQAAVPGPPSFGRK